jgi:hypothetical protein
MGSMTGVVPLQMLQVSALLYARLMQGEVQ